MLSILTLLSSLVFTGFAEDKEYDIGNGKVAESYACEDENCDFNWTLYENGLMVVSGNIGSHQTVYTKKEVKKVFIDETVKGSLGGWFFYYLTQNKEFSVSKNNSLYTTENGVLFNSDKTTLIAYPLGRTDESFEIPASVKRIENDAFYESKLKSITIPDTVSYVGIGAFSKSSLESVAFENGERKLVIAGGAFNSCEALSNISLFGNRVYAMSSDAFYNTAFFNNPFNWENGVLYLNDILLAVDQTKIGEEYTIKDGTTTIADGATFIYSPSGKDKDAIEVTVTIPESVDNIGIASVYLYDKLPSNTFRIGSIISHEGWLGFTALKIFSQYEEEYNSILNKYGCSKENKDNLPMEAKIELAKKKYFFSSYYKWLNFALPITEETSGVVFVDDDIVGIADNSYAYLYDFAYLVYVQLSPYYFNGLILPESFENLSWHTELCDDYVKFYMINKEYTEKSVTFLNPDCKIFDDENTLWDGYTICGYKGSTAEAYANKYERKFVAIDDCKHEQTCRNAEISATCASEGFSGDLHCQYCGELLEEGKRLPKTDNHDFEKKETLVSPSCTKAGTGKYVCKTCGKEEIMPVGKPHGHLFRIYLYDERPATCTTDGCIIYDCVYCGITKTEITEKATGHKDENNDGRCDVCDTEICSHICHKSGISKLFYKIALIFWKLFRTNKYCSCGVAHY